LKVSEIPINEKIIKVLTEIGITDLFPPQSMALETDVLDGTNLVLAIPTSSGKTLVAEICMLKTILDGRGKAIYLVPLRSLAREKYQDFKKYNSLGITTAMSVGDYDSPGTKLQEADIVVLTTERLDSLVRHRTDWIQDVGTVVVDEIHLINDISRGPTLEMVLAKLIQMQPSIQIVGLSATISNADEIAGWLDANLVKSDWRPVPLTEGVALDDEIIFGDTEKRAIKRKHREAVSDLICDILDEKGQVLVFVSSRRSTVALSKRVASDIRPYLEKRELEYLSRISSKIGSKLSATETTKTLSKVLNQGIAFHHAGLDNQERGVVEDAFRNNYLKVIVATPTLAAGVNLPARRVIIRDVRRFEQSRGSYFIPVLEYKQMAGRAGRPRYDEYGEAILLARTEHELDFLTERYVLSESEIITSKLASSESIRFHILSVIASDMSSTRDELDSLIDSTFFSFQFDTRDIEHHVSSSLHFLEQNGLIESIHDDELQATLLGKRTSQLYIDPVTAIKICDAFSKKKTYSQIGILHLLCNTPDQPLSYVTQSETGDYEFIMEDNLNDLFVEPPDEWDDPEGYSKFIAQIKTASILQDWIEERSEREITDNYNVGTGDIHRFVQSATWLLYAATEIAKITDASNYVRNLNELQSRMKYGIKSELLELVSLRGVGRVRSRMLYNHGLKSLSDLYQVKPEELGRVPTVGTSLASSIKKQLGLDLSDVSVEHEPEFTEPDDNDTMQTLLLDFDN
jgi:helicase